MVVVAMRAEVSSEFTPPLIAAQDNPIGLGEMEELMEKGEERETCEG